MASIWIQCSCGASMLSESTPLSSNRLKATTNPRSTPSPSLRTSVPTSESSPGFFTPPSTALGQGLTFAGHGWSTLPARSSASRDTSSYGSPAQTFFNTANVVTAVQNFPNYSGTIVGFMKGFLGISGAVLTQFYQTLFKGELSTFLLMLALTNYSFPCAHVICDLSVVRVHHAQAKDEKGYLNGFSMISLIVAAYIMFWIIVDNILSISMDALFDLNCSLHHTLFTSLYCV